MKLARRTAGVCVAVAACITALVAATNAIPQDSAPNPSHATVTVADDQPGYAVEDYLYPNADKIKEETGIVLKRGDGHITLATCDSATGLLEVWSRTKDRVCFRTVGTSGYLSLEIPSVFAVKGSAAHTADVTLTAAENASQEVEVPKDTWTPVGEATDPQTREFALVEIRTSK